MHEPAHNGYEATLRRISQRFWWPRVRNEVSAFVRACEVCDRDRVANPSPRAPLGHLPADELFASLYIDIVGNHGSLSLGALAKYILTMIDGLTVWADALPIADQSTPQSLALSTPSGFRDMVSRNNCTPIVGFSSSLQCSRSCAQCLNREDANDSVQTSGERKMREVQSDAYFDAATRGTKTSIRLKTAAVAGVTGVSIDYLLSDRIHTVSTDFRPRDALADRFRDTAA